ncbi:MAG: hypothetical protein ACK57B_13100 [Betaproteobacteria bacterium]
MRTDLRLLPVAVAALVAMAGGGAIAQTSPWFVGGLLSMTHDDNLLRLGDGQPPPAGQSRSDAVRSAALIGGLDQSFGRQRLQANLTLRQNRFDRNDRYDNESYSGGVSLDWTTVNRLSGRLGASRSRALSTFNAEVIGLLAQSNFETTEVVDASVRLGLVTAWSLELTGATRRTRNSLDLPTVQAQNLDQDSAAVGLAWRPGAAFDATLSARESRGRYPTFRSVNGSFEDDRFTQRSLELATGWQPSGASRLEARIGSGQTQYQRGGNRDFDSISGSLNWTWRPTGKLTATTGLSRERGQDNYPTFVRVPVGFFLFDLPAVQANLRTIDTLRGQLDWAASAKVGVSAGLQYARRDASVRTRTVPDDVLRFSAEGIDQTTVLSLGARWSATRWAQLGCDLRHEKRRATGNVTAGLAGTSLSCSAQATLR